MSKNLVLTYYHTGDKDLWHYDIDIYKCNNREFDTLYDSVMNREKKYDFYTIANELRPDRENWTVSLAINNLEKPDNMSLYVHKFIACYEFLKMHPEYDEIWIVDSADTEMLKTPEPNDYSLYSGYDAYNPLFKQFYPIKYFVGGFVEGGVWLPGIFEKGIRFDDDIDRYLRELHGDDVGWNCGVVGGKRKPVMDFLEKLVPILKKNVSDTEMTAFNYVIYKYFLKYGDEVKCCTTRMTLGEKDMSKWWRHK